MSPSLMWMGGGGGNSSGASQGRGHCDWFKQTVKLHQPIWSPSPFSMVVKHGSFPFHPPKELFLQFDQSSVCLMMLHLERLRWDSTWACVWGTSGQALSHVMELSAWAGWGNFWTSSTAHAVLLQLKKHLEIFHLWDSVATGSEDGKEEWWMGIAQPNTSGKEMHINPFCLTPLDFRANHSLYKILKSGYGT